MQIRTALIIGLTLFSSLNMVQADNAKGLIQTDRYSAVEPEPTTEQAVPLLTLVTIKILKAGSSMIFSLVSLAFFGSFNLPKKDSKKFSSTSMI